MNVHIDIVVCVKVVYKSPYVLYIKPVSKQKYVHHPFLFFLGLFVLFFHFIAVSHANSSSLFNFC